VERAIWYSGLGVTLFVIGMLVSAFALRGLAQRRRLRAEPHGLGWLGIFRLGLVQALGAIVVLTTSTLNRVMVVELATAGAGARPAGGAALRGAAERPRMGFGSDRGGRRTPWIVGGMAVLALGGFGAAVATAWMALTAPQPGMALAVLASPLVGLGVSAAGTSLLVLLATRVPAPRRAAAATLVWVMMIVGFAGHRRHRRAASSTPTRRRGWWRCRAWSRCSPSLWRCWRWPGVSARPRARWCRRPRQQRRRRPSPIRGWRCARSGASPTPGASRSSSSSRCWPTARRT
jgi:hypothetical protein